MKSHRHFKGLLFILLTWSARFVLCESASPTQQTELDNITQRVYSGDYNALYDSAKMPAPIAVPYLYFWVRNGGNPSVPRDEVVSGALRKVQGYAAYLQQDIAKGIAAGGVASDDFEILGLIGTPDAAAVAAPYLFDSKVYIDNNGETWDNACGAAINALSSMNLPGAPKGTPLTPGLRNSVLLVEWQKWAIAKGLVPKEWSSRVGAPAWMLGEEANESAGGRSIAAQSPQYLPPVHSPAPATANSPVPTNTSSIPATAQSPVETKDPGHSFGILISVVLILLVIGGVIALKKRP
jgi:hypothetical protein